MPCIHAEWAISGDDVRDASRRLSYFYWNTMTGPKYSNGRAILHPNVEMNCTDIFMWYIFWSMWNHCPINSQQEEMAQCWWQMLRKKNSLSWSVNRLLLSLYQQAGGLEVNTIIGDVMDWRNNKSIKLWRSDDLTLRSQIGWAVPRECNTRMCDPKCGLDCKQRCCCDSREILVFRGE